MEHKKHTKTNNPNTSGPAATDSSGLSFQAEPTGLERNPVASEGKHPDPAHDSSHAAFTPGGAPQSRPAFAPRRISTMTMVALALAVAVLLLIVVLL